MSCKRLRGLAENFLDEVSQTSSFASIEETTDFGECDTQSQAFVSEERDPNVECHVDELYAWTVQENTVLCNLKKEYNAFQQRQIKTYSTDVCCYVSPTTRRKKEFGGTKWGNLIQPTVSLDWNALEDPPLLVFDKMMICTKNLPYDDKLLSENVFAVLQGSYSCKLGNFCIPHLSSVCVNNTSAPYYLNLDTKLPSDIVNPFQYLFPFVPPEDANCEIVSVFDGHIKAEVLLLRNIRPVPIGQQLTVSQVHSVSHITTKRGHGRKMTWFKDVCVSELVEFSSSV